MTSMICLDISVHVHGLPSLHNDVLEGREGFFLLLPKNVIQIVLWDHGSTKVMIGFHKRKKNMATLMMTLKRA